MASSKLPDDMPFGYDFRQSSSFALPSPPVPAPGPSLLDDNESKFLDSFFAGVNSDHFNFDFFTNAADGTDLALGWDELPPTFMGTSSSYGQQPQAPPPPPPPPGMSSMISGATNSQSPTLMETAPDVLAAAALLQNGPNGLRGMEDNSIFGNGHDPLLSANNMIGHQSLAQYNAQLCGPSLHSPPAHNLHQRHSVPNPYLFGSPHDGLPRSPTRPRPPLQFGSDVSFGTTSGLVQPTSHIAIEALDRAQMHTVETFIEALQNPSTADNTRTPSPQPFAPPPRSEHHNAYEESDDRPRKRRKNTFVDFEDDEDDEDGDYPDPSPTHKPNGTASRQRPTAKSLSNPKTFSPSGPGHKRRKSSTQQAINAASKARENLTEDQKRENHIKSEQKRRTLIREGFEDLNELVPGLKQGGHSKSAVLGMAADWLEELIRENEKLRERCEDMSKGQ